MLVNGEKEYQMQKERSKRGLHIGGHDEEEGDHNTMIFVRIYSTIFHNPVCSMKS